MPNEPYSIETESLLRQIDDDLGESATYWYGLLSVSMHNQDEAEALIRRIQQHARQAPQDQRDLRIAELEAELRETRETLAVAQSGVLDKQLLADAQAERDAAIVRCRALAESLRGYLLQYPAFRNKPLGSEGSPARIEQEILIEAEDLAKRLIGEVGH